MGAAVIFTHVPNNDVAASFNQPWAVALHRYIRSSNKDIVSIILEVTEA